MPGEHDLALPTWAAPFIPTFERVAHHLELAEGFMLVPVELPDVITADLLARWLTPRGVPCSLVDPELHDASPPLLEQLLAAPQDAAATLLFVDKLTAQLPGALQLLNQQRDVLARRHPRPLLWSGPARFLDLTWRSAPDLWSIATVPIRLAATTSAVDRHKALYDLLIAMYSGDELRRLIYYQFGDVGDLLPTNAPMARLVDELIRILEQRGLLDHAFFDLLRSERPRRYAEIDAVARLWSDPARPPASVVDEARSQALLRHALGDWNQIVIVVGIDLQRLHECIQETMHELRLTRRVRAVPLPAMDDEEIRWSGAPRSEPTPRSAALRSSPEITLVVDAAGRPLITPDHAQLTEIRRLARETADAWAHGHASQLVIPLASTREVAEATARSLSAAIKRTKFPVHILELDGAPSP